MLFDRINDKRAELGLARLTWSDGIHAATNIRSHELPSLYDHARPDGRTWYSVFEEVGLPYNGARENLVYGGNAAFSDIDTLVRELYNGWINSPAHYENLTAGDVSSSAICAIYSGSDIYVTQLFLP